MAVLGDVHTGSPFNPLDKLRRIVDEINTAQPDVVCLLGDLVIHGVMGGTFVAPEPIADELARLRAPAGVFAVLGNHDVWFDAGRVRTALTTRGIPVLEETAVKLETPAGPVWLAGVSDFMTGRPDAAAALAGVSDSTSPVILLSHNPDVFPDVPARATLTLAAHTHGGQVRLPFFGTPIVPSKFGDRFAAGHIVEGGRHLFVTTGVGTSILPVRFRVPPSAALLTIGPGR